MKKSHALGILQEIEQALAAGNRAESVKPLIDDLSKAAAAEGTPLVSDNAAVFLYFGPAQAVEACSDYNEETGEVVAPLKRLAPFDVWVVRETLRPDAEFLYRLRVDGESKHDPLCKEMMEGFGTLSVGRMPDNRPVPEMEFRPDIDHGALESFEFRSRFLKNVRRISVYLPPDYRKSHRHYPVLYVQDGDASLSQGRFDRIVDNLLADGKIQPLIMVLVPPVNRTFEYWFEQQDYEKFLTQELAPHVSERYRTPADPALRAITGASLGGRISTHIAANHPDLFGICIGQSSYFEENSEIIARLREREKLPIRFYYDVGVFERTVGKGFGESFTRDLVTVNRNLRDLLREKQYDVAYREWPSGHNMLAWGRGMVEALQIFFGR